MKYLTVRDHLRALIADELGVGDSIPSERELCAQIPRALLEQMPKTTRREIRYHGAERVGDLIFNWFD